MNEPQTYVDLQDAGNAQAQLILQAIARHADWNSGECYPSQEAISRMAKCSVRTVRSYLARLESDGFITRDERRKKNGAVQTDLITLVGYQQWITALREGGNVAKPKEVQRYEQAANLAACQEANLAGAPGNLLSAPPGKQVAANNKPSLNTHGTKSAQAREVNSIGSGSEVKRAAATFDVTVNCVQWEQWMALLRSRGREDMEAAARAKRLIRVVGSRWPKDDSPLPFIDGGGLSEKSKRMSGDAA